MAKITLVITRRHLSGYSEEGDWLEGDTRELGPDYEDTYSPDAEDRAEHGGAYAAVAAYLRKMVTGDGWQPSAYPIGEAAGRSEWLGMTDQRAPGDPHWDFYEYSAYVRGATEQGRAKVFRAATK